MPAASCLLHDAFPSPVQGQLGGRTGACRTARRRVKGMSDGVFRRRTSRYVRTTAGHHPRAERSGDGVIDVRDPGGNRVVPVRGVRLRRHAGRGRRAAGLPRLRRLGFVRASLFAGGRFPRGTPRTRAAPSARRWSRRGARRGHASPASTSPSTTAATSASCALEREWTRIGRSLAADVRFDDPTVSRRHALIVRQADGVRVLDDRSLNGVFVNGERVEWRALGDGDEIVVGRYRLHFLEHGGRAREPGGPDRGRRLTPPGERRATGPTEERDGAGPVATPGSVPTSRQTEVGSARGHEDRGPLPEGRHRQDDGGPAPRPTASAARASRVLAVDLDPQGNLSDYFDVAPDAEPTIGDVLDRRARRPARPSTTTSSRRTSSSPRPSSRWRARWAAS